MQKFGKEVADALEIMRRDRKIYSNYLSDEAKTAGMCMLKVTRGLCIPLMEKLIALLYKEMPLEHPYQAVWWYSVLFKMKMDKDIFGEGVRYIRANKRAFSLNTIYYLFFQLTYLYDSNPIVYDKKTKLELWKLFQEIVEEFAKAINVPLTEIPENERDKDLVLVILMQYVELGHAPTITGLDRCNILQKTMGKKVLLLNTGEAINTVGRIPFAESIDGHNIIVNSDSLQWKDAIIPYYQCECKMPDIDMLNQLLQQIRQMAPGRVVLISGTSVLGNLVNKMIPALTISTGFSDFALTSAKYQAVGRSLTSEDKDTLEDMGYNLSHVIESIFTFDIKPQKNVITRKMLNISEDAFVMVIVGGRLNAEITDEFLDFLERLPEGLYIAFLGMFHDYESRMNRFPKLKKKCINFGFCEDVLAYLEVCDLYLNPQRKGGGSSVVEALFKGKPVVSMAYGDAYINAGEDFCVRSYEEMEQQILRYYNDKDYYHQMSEKAKKRADILLDSASAFVKVMDEYDRRERERSLN